MWALVVLIAFAAEVSQGVGWQSLMTFSMGFLSLLIFLASFVNKKAEWKLGQFDFLFGGLSLVGLFLWWITKIGNIAIIFSILADGLAAVPTIVKSYNYPETESVWIYLTAFINAGITILTIKQWQFAYYAFPVYILGLTFTFCFLILLKPKKYLEKAK